MTQAIEIVEVGPRDGFQSVGSFIPTEVKIAILRALHAAGVRRVEATSFVSPNAVPQLADATEILRAAETLPDLDAQVLVPTASQAERALAAGALHLSFVVSVSEAHNRGNVRRSPQESAEEYAAITRMLPAGVKMRLNLATAFDCPYAGRVDEAATVALLEQMMPVLPEAEIALCDTTGRVTPDHVTTLFRQVQERLPHIRAWAFHAHDTYGLGAANSLAAFYAGVRTFDASVAGLGGCPFAPGATGNVATEDLIWMFNGMAISSGIDLDGLLLAAQKVATLPGGQTGGRVRDALASARGARN